MANASATRCYAAGIHLAAAHLSRVLRTVSHNATCPIGQYRVNLNCGILSVIKHTT
jgi:hypothetical protein